MRYERKYRISGQHFNQVHHHVMSNPAAFHKSYPDRYVNSIYYDTNDYQYYHENVQGVSNRVKYRIRWYGEDMYKVENPIIEKKIKSNMLGRKEYVSLDHYNLNLSVDSFKSIAHLNQKDLVPVTLVRYKRTYLESFDRLIRATIDQQLEYHPINSGISSVNASPDDAIILEIKYDEKMSESVDFCLQSVPYRMTKNSKYVSAFNHING